MNIKFITVNKTNNRKKECRTNVYDLILQLFITAFEQYWSQGIKILVQFNLFITVVTYPNGEGRADAENGG